MLALGCPQAEPTSSAEAEEDELRIPTLVRQRGFSG